MKIIKSTEPIAVEHPVFLIFGQPGIGKTSLGYSAIEPLLLDCDAGAHRAINRCDTLAVAGWSDITDLMLIGKSDLSAYRTIVVDTVGRLLDLMTVDIIEETPKYARDGNLTQQGWGVLKTRFRTWLAQLRAMGKDVILIAHHREDKDGDVIQVRPDITGGSYGEVLKNGDCVGFLSMVGKHRVLDFNPTDRWVGKNPAGWKPIQIPPAAKATHVLADLMTQARAALGNISAESAAVASQADTWRATIENYSSAEQISAAIPVVNELEPMMLKQQMRALLAARAKALGCTYNPSTKQYDAPALAHAD